MFMLKNCPHCQRAIKIMDQLMLKEEFKNIEIKMIDEQKHSDIADRYDYYYVPTYYIDDKKVHEGVPTKEKLQLVLEQAIASE